jgi:hypothetical protein
LLVVVVIFERRFCGERWVEIVVKMRLNCSGIFARLKKVVSISEFGTTKKKKKLMGKNGKIKIWNAKSGDKKNDGKN